MNAPTPVKRITAEAIRARKGGEPVVAVTAYTARLAEIADAHADFLLVGDSVGMVTYGFENTLPVTIGMMLNHGRAVVRGTQKSLIVVDLPFGTYEESFDQAMRSAALLIKETGCGAVKLEGGLRMAETIRFIAERGIPVMGHVGLTPQSVNTLGFRAQGRSIDEWAALEDDAQAVADAGAFAMVLEAMAEPLAARITQTVKIPTIGIGSGAVCDGQILVLDDLLGLTARTPKFVKRYADMAGAADQALAAYAADVKARAFPAPEHTYAMRDTGGPKLKSVKS